MQNGDRQLEGLMSISSYISREGHESRVWIGGGANRLEDELRQYNPSVVGMYVLTKDHIWATEKAKEIKSISPNSIVLLGGPHPTHYHKLALEEGIDGICIGEGEKLVLHILNAIRDGRNWRDAKSLYYSENGILIKNELDVWLGAGEIPLPDRKLYQNIEGVRDQKDLQVMSSRGCPHTCNFCGNWGIKRLFGSTRVRIKSPENVIREIKEARERGKIETIHFQDDMFGLQKRWLEDFSRMYTSEIKEPFYALLRCDSVTSDFIRTLKSIGCYEIGIGVESGNERIRNEVLGKRLTDEDIFNAVGILKDENMRFHTFNMFGLPEEMIENAFETIDMNIELQPTVAYAQMFHPYPGTRFFTTDTEPHIIGRNFDLFANNYQYTRDTPRIQRLQKLAMAAVEFPSLRPFLPGMIELPLENRQYEEVSKEFWEKVYHKRLKNKEKHLT
jgi:radical SAM superfamily enzyme YgiQ (UPF0313 family)